MGNGEVIDDEYLRELKRRIYLTKTNLDGKARTPNHQGMRNRRYDLLEEKLITGD